MQQLPRYLLYMLLNAEFSYEFAFSLHCSHQRFHQSIGSRVEHCCIGEESLLRCFNAFPLISTRYRSSEGFLQASAYGHNVSKKTTSIISLLYTPPRPESNAGTSSASRPSQCVLSRSINTGRIPDFLLQQWLRKYPQHEPLPLAVYIRFC